MALGLQNVVSAETNGHPAAELGNELVSGKGLLQARRGSFSSQQIVTLNAKAELRFHRPQ